LINFFLVKERIYFVDLPGYGFAKVPKAVKDTWGRMIEDYLVNRGQLKLAFLLVDCRRPPADSDVTMKNWMDYHRIPNAIILTKADKISRNQLKQALQTSAAKLNTKEITAFSAVTALGKEEILRRVEAAID
jgi:GTP-binding protein